MGRHARCDRTNPSVLQCYSKPTNEFIEEIITEDVAKTWDFQHLFRNRTKGNLTAAHGNPEVTVHGGLNRMDKAMRCPAVGCMKAPFNDPHPVVFSAEITISQLGNTRNHWYRNQFRYAFLPLRRAETTTASPDGISCPEG